MQHKRACKRQDKQIPAELREWLYASGSLTQQLTDLADGEFKVQPIQEHFLRLSFADSQWMNMPHQHTSWVRESYLYGCEVQPWVKAKRSEEHTSELQSRENLVCRLLLEK